MIINITGIESVQSRSHVRKPVNTTESKEPKIKIPTNLITAKVIEYKHLKFKVFINNILMDVVVVDYQPKIIFSAKINTYWVYPKPSEVIHRDDIYDLDIYWDYLYDDLEVKGLVVDNKFVLNNDCLHKQLEKIFKEYKRQQLIESKLNKKKL